MGRSIVRQRCASSANLRDSRDRIHGHLIGREQERDRIRQLLHELLSSKILAASFVTHEIYQNLSATGSEEAKELAKVTKLLHEVINGIVHGFGEAYITSRINTSGGSGES